jgi:hypothetical protein
VTGVWGADPMAVDSRDWGWISKSYVGANHKRPFYNKAKELLFSGRQVTSYIRSSERAKARQVYECATATVTVEAVVRLPVSETFTQ